VAQRAVPLVGKMTAQNFKLYEALNLPMLLMFLDLTHEDKAVRGVVGGRSGGILNQILIDEMRDTAKEHVGRLVFVYLDGPQHEDQMKSLGLYGGRERLPSLAFNTKDGSQIPFPEELPVNKDTLLRFCADFVTGKLKNKADAAAMAKKALQATQPLNRKNTVIREEVRKAPEKVRGITEQFGDGDVGDEDITVLTAKSFESVAMDEEKDVLLMLHAQGCEKCGQLAVYYKRMAQRFQNLSIPSLLITRMDVTHEAPPAHLNLLVGPLPILILFPASEKRPPWLFYTGIGKVQQIMKWVHQHASIPFHLPDLPHLSESDRVLYKKQIREREEHLAEEREKEAADMKAEEIRQKEYFEQKQKQKQSYKKKEREEEEESLDFEL